MIFWIASYPKSGNTWLRALISTYYFSKDGAFDESLLKKIDQFPTRKYFSDFEYNQKVIGDTCKYWIKAQEKINIDKNAEDWLIDEGFSASYGARPLKRVVQNFIEDKLALMIISNELEEDKEVLVSSKNNELIFKVK